MFKRIAIATLLTICLLFSFVIPVLADSGNWVIEGDKVYVDDENVYLSASPHTLGSSGWVEFEVTSKKLKDKVDVFWGFNSVSGVTVSKPQIWTEDVAHTLYQTVEVERVDKLVLQNISSYTELVVGSYDADIGNESNIKLVRVYRSITDDTPLTTNPLYIACYKFKVSKGTGTFDFYYTTTIQEPYIEYYPDWELFTGKLTKIHYYYNGYDEWHCVRINSSVKTGLMYKFRVWVEIPFVGEDRLQGKYLFGIKQGDKTFEESEASGNLYLIDPWWNISWYYRRTITFDNTASAIDLVNWAVLVKLTDGVNIDYTKTQNEGQDIRFVDSDDTTPLDYEIELWDESGDSFVWVRVPNIPAGDDTDFIWMYYGNTEASDGQDVEGTWNSDLLVVQHMNEDPTGGAPQAIDSTDNNNDGTGQLGKFDAGDLVEATADGGIDFEIAPPVDKDYYLIDDNATVEPCPITIELFVNLESMTVSTGIIGKIDAGNSEGYMLGHSATGNIGCWMNIVGQGWQGSWNLGGAITLATDHQLIATFDVETIKTYIDAIYQNQDADPNNPIHYNAADLTIGVHRLGTSWTDGTVDEFRLWDRVLDIDEIEANWLIYEDNFNTFGEQVPLALPSFPPVDFTITQSDVDTATLTWEMGLFADTTVIRVQKDSYPSSPTDGWEAYNGAGITTDDVGLNLEVDSYYYRAWSYNEEYGYSEEYAEGRIGGGSMFQLGLIVLALGFTVSGYIFRKSALAYAAAGCWVLLGFFAFQLSSSSNPTQITDVYMGLFWLCMMLTIVCILEPSIMKEPSKVLEDEDNLTDMDRLAAEYDEMHQKMNPNLIFGKRHGKPNKWNKE